MSLLYSLDGLDKLELCSLGLNITLLVRNMIMWLKKKNFCECIVKNLVWGRRVGEGSHHSTVQIVGKHFDFQSLQFFHWQVVCVCVRFFFNCRTFLQEKEKV